MTTYMGSSLHTRPKPNRSRIPAGLCHSLIHEAPYNYLIAADYAVNCVIGDALVCDINGNPEPGYEFPRPFDASVFGELV